MSETVATSPEDGTEESAGRRPVSLRMRLVLILSGIISLILVGQTLVALSGEVADLDSQISTRGTILAQSLASASVTLMGGDNPSRFEPLFQRIGRVLDVTEVAVVSRAGRIVAHSDPSRVGEAERGEPFGVFSLPRPRLGLSDFFAGEIEYTVSAPVVQGTVVLGFVRIGFRSREVSERAVNLIASASGVALFWLFVGAVAGTIYVRRITRPLAALTGATTAISEGRIEDVRLAPPTTRDEIGQLQGAFVQLLDALGVARRRNAELLEEQKALNARLQDRVEEVDADLRETTAYLRAVIRAIGEGLVTCDRDGVIVQANRASHRQLAGIGVPRPGLPIRELIADGEELEVLVKAVMATGLPREMELVRFDPTRADRAREVGSPAGGRLERTVHVRAFPLKDADPDAHPDAEARGVVLMLLDETEKKQVESALRRHDRLVSLGTIAAGLAHELGNYMHTINGFSTVLLYSMKAEDPLRSDVQAIHDDNTKAVALLDRFLQFARPGGGHYHPQPVGALVREAIDVCRYRIRKANVTVVDELGEEEILVRCDAQLLQQVFVNLVLNAIDAMEGRDERRLTVKAQDRGDEHVELRFADTGEGIDADHLDRIFDPFFTTKADTGTGLGLSIAHQIIDRHEGRISVGGRKDAGTTFTIVLPVGGPRGGGA